MNTFLKDFSRERVGQQSILFHAKSGIMTLKATQPCLNHLIETPQDLPPLSLAFKKGLVACILNVATCLAGIYLSANKM